MSIQPRASLYTQPRASPARLCAASWQPACADRIQLANNHLRESMLGLSRSSPASQKSAHPNHIQLTKSQLIQIISIWPTASLSWHCPAQRELLGPNRIQQAESQPGSIISSLEIAILSKACPTSRSSPEIREPAPLDYVQPAKLVKNVSSQ